MDQNHNIYAVEKIFLSQPGIRYTDNTMNNNDNMCNNVYNVELIL